MARKKAVKKTARKKTSKKKDAIKIPVPSSGIRGGKTGNCTFRSHSRLSDSLADPNAHFHKALNHSADSGEVDLPQYKKMIKRLQELNHAPRTRAKNGFKLRDENGDDNIRNFVNPQSGWSTDSELSDPCCFEIPEAPAITSTSAAAEAIEDYWMALLRDVPFVDWSSNADVATAASELSGYPLYINANNPNGNPNEASAAFESISLNHKSVFRGGELARFSNPSAGISESVGPFVSQFLLHEINYGTLVIPQKFVHATSGINYMTDWSEWLKVQNGEKRDAKQNLIGAGDPTQRRHMSTMRDLATYVHFDQLYEAYLNAALILLENQYPTNPGNPYGPGCSAIGIGQDQSKAYTEQYESLCQLYGSKHAGPLYPDQDGFGTHGGPGVLTLVTEVATRALKAVWRQKWTLLRLRPEAYAGLVERSLGSAQSSYNGFPTDVQSMLAHSEAISRSRGGTDGCNWMSSGNALLPMAFPEGSPTHPAYGAGHATVAGACVTILKALFDGRAQFKNPVEASACGQSLEHYCDSDANEMTVQSELHKLAANIAVGRDMAGVHWRSDYTQSMLLGQRVAIDMLYHQKNTYTEKWAYKFETFGGVPIEINQEGVYYSPGSNGVYSVCFDARDSTSCTLAEALKEIV